MHSSGQIGTMYLESRRCTLQMERCMKQIWFQKTELRLVLCGSLDLVPNGDILFLLPHVTLRVLSTYVRSMDAMDKMCDGHLWCTTKTTNIQNDFGLFFRRTMKPWHLIDSPPCRTPCRLFIHKIFFGPLGFHLRVWSEPGRFPPFRPMRALRLHWSRAFNRAFEVAVTSGKLTHHLRWIHGTHLTSIKKKPEESKHVEHQSNLRFWPILPKNPSCDTGFEDRAFPFLSFLFLLSVCTYVHMYIC